MIRAKTCLILGAGASRPYRLPTGAELRNLILVADAPEGDETEEKFPPKQSPLHKRDDVAKKYGGSTVRGWDNFLRPLMLQKFGQELLLDFRRQFYQARASSIDKFVQSP